MTTTGTLALRKPPATLAHVPAEAWACAAAAYLRRAGLRLDDEGRPVWTTSSRTAFGGLRRVLVVSGALAEDADADRSLAAVLAAPWDRIDYALVATIRANLRDHRSAKTGKPFSKATVAASVAALRGVLREAWRLGRFDAEALARITDDLKTKRDTTSTDPAGRYVSASERARLFACVEDSPAGARDAAALGLLFGGGLRRAEAVRLTLDDLADDADGGTMTLRVHGKGGKVRSVPLANGSRAAVLAWLKVRGSEPGYLLCPVNRGGEVDRSKGVTTQALYGWLAKVATAAGVSSLAPRDARRTVASDLLDTGNDLPTVQAFLGHASPTTTARYDRRGDRAKVRAAQSLAVPFVIR
ncbi:MAG: tyrosine-type recombinase/integrase [Planctomycetota bacterium]